MNENRINSIFNAKGISGDLAGLVRNQAAGDGITVDATWNSKRWDSLKDEKEFYDSVVTIRGMAAFDSDLFEHSLFGVAYRDAASDPQVDKVLRVSMLAVVGTLRDIIRRLHRAGANLSPAVYAFAYERGRLDRQETTLGEDDPLVKVFHEYHMMVANKSGVAAHLAKNRNHEIPEGLVWAKHECTSPTEEKEFYHSLIRFYGWNVLEFDLLDKTLLGEAYKQCCTDGEQIWAPTANAVFAEHKKLIKDLAAAGLKFSDAVMAYANGTGKLGD